MAYSAATVANSILDVAETHGASLTHMKLQKLAYYSHGWHLALMAVDHAGEDDECVPLIEGGIEAWKYGPVIKPLYHACKDFGKSTIDGRISEVRFRQTDFVRVEPRLPVGEFPHMLVEKIWEVYGHLSAVQLSKMTHADGSPWSIVTSRFVGEHFPPNLRIPDELILKCFQQEMSGA